MTIRRGMNGEYVRRIQERLLRLSLYRGPLDSGFGGGTEASVKRFQQDQRLPVTGLVDGETWKRLFDGEDPPVSEFFKATPQQRSLALSGSFETGSQPPECFSGVAGDFDGQGISFGVLQWNLGQGTLQPMLAEAFEKHERLCRDIFHEHFDTLRALGRASRDEQLDFARSIQTRGRINEPWRGMLKSLGRTTEFQNIQGNRSTEIYNRSKTLCRDYGLTSQRGAALMFDIVVQNGSISDLVKSQILADFVQIPDMKPEDKEVARMRVIANRRAAAARPEYVDDVRTRKLLIANGSGTLHGIYYDLADRFCLTMDRFDQSPRLSRAAAGK